MSKSINNFINRLKEQKDDEIVYSKPSSNSIKIIPPTLKKEEKTFTFKVNREISVEEQERIQDDYFKSLKKEKEEQLNKIKKERETIPQPKLYQLSEEDMLFEKSGTDKQYYNRWIELYRKANNKRKTDKSINLAVREGRFKVFNDSQIAILPKLNINNLSFNDIVSLKWLKK